MVKNELERLIEGADNSESQGKYLTSFLVDAPNNAHEVIKKCKEVLSIVLRQEKDLWPSEEDWRNKLPPWFIKLCAKEISQEEAKRRILLPIEERIRLSKEEGWALSAWIYWFKPDERQWFWWDSKIPDENNVIITVESDAWPFPWGSLDWLLRASGATNVKEL